LKGRGRPHGRPLRPPLKRIKKAADHYRYIKRYRIQIFDEEVRA
jgi:hypothetical protein